MSQGVRRSDDNKAPYTKTLVERTDGPMEGCEFWEFVPKNEKDDKFFIGRCEKESSVVVNNFTIGIAPSTQMMFWANERPRSFYPTNKLTFENIQCKTRHEVELFENDTLNSCTLSAPAKFNSTLLPSGVRIFNDRYGRLERALTCEQTDIGGTSYPKDTVIFFNSDGSIRKISLPKPSNEE